MPCLFQNIKRSYPRKEGGVYIYYQGINTAVDHMMRCDTLRTINMIKEVEQKQQYEYEQQTREIGRRGQVFIFF